MTASTSATPMHTGFNQRASRLGSSIGEASLKKWAVAMFGTRLRKALCRCNKYPLLPSHGCSLKDNLPATRHGHDIVTALARLLRSRLFATLPLTLWSHDGGCKGGVRQGH